MSTACWCSRWCRRGSRWWSAPASIALFGPLIVVGLGGILVELLKDTALAPAPVTTAQAHALLDQLKGGKLLDGFRNLPTVDRGRLAEIICRVSEFAADQADMIAEVDVNPLICAGTPSRRWTR